MKVQIKTHRERERGREGNTMKRERERERGMTGISMFLTFTGIVGEMDEA